MNIVAEEELRRKKRLAKKEREQESQGGSRYREGKKRRISDQSEDDGDHASSRDGESIVNKTPERLSQVKADLSSAIRPTSPVKPTVAKNTLFRSYVDTVAAAKTPAEKQTSSNVIDLESDDSTDPVDEEDTVLEVAAVKAAKPSIYDDIDLSDEEFPELARQAREKARRKRLQSDFPAKVTPDPPPGPTIAGSSGRSESVLTLNGPPPSHDPVVSILITSRITNTNPLIVNRRIGQRLKEVRVTWCQKQQFSSEFSAAVILVWRGQRLFDITSCKSLGISVDDDGNIVIKSKKDILGEEGHKIHIEAMTEEMFKEEKRAKIRGPSETVQEYGTEQTVVESPVQEEQVKIILKAKGFEEFKLIVKPVRANGKKMYSSFLTFM